jgi:hypothetical protein
MFGGAQHANAKAIGQRPKYLLVGSHRQAQLCEGIFWHLQLPVNYPLIIANYMMILAL